jgi:hypothetical protein
MIDEAPMRILPIALLLLVGCGSEPPSTGSAEADDRIDCRIGASTGFERHCRIEQGEADVIVIRKPDGGFRRLRFVDDGRGVVAADGAEPAIVTIIAAGEIDVAIGGDNFRLPATIRP